MKRSLAAILLFGLQSALADQPIWLLVDTKAHVLKVMRGEKPVEVFEGIAIGRRGVARDYRRRRGDHTTPLGRFRIAWINEKSKFHLFFGLNYPTLPYASTAFKEGWIDGKTFRQLIVAYFEGKKPPQNTVLGGYIGIHGLGKADPVIHKALDWTEGCIALTDEQIDRLKKWIKIGTEVVIC